MDMPSQNSVSDTPSTIGVYLSDFQGVFFSNPNSKQQEWVTVELGKFHQLKCLRELERVEGGCKQVKFPSWPS